VQFSDIKCYVWLVQHGTFFAVSELPGLTMASAPTGRFKGTFCAIRRSPVIDNIRSSET